MAPSSPSSSTSSRSVGGTPTAADRLPLWRGAAASAAASVVPPATPTTIPSAPSTPVSPVSPGSLHNNQPLAARFPVGGGGGAGPSLAIDNIADDDPFLLEAMNLAAENYAKKANKPAIATPSPSLDAAGPTSSTPQPLTSTQAVPPSPPNTHQRSPSSHVSSPASSMATIEAAPHAAVARVSRLSSRQRPLSDGFSKAGTALSSWLSPRASTSIHALAPPNIAAPTSPLAEHVDRALDPTYSSATEGQLDSSLLQLNSVDSSKQSVEADSRIPSQSSQVFSHFTSPRASKEEPPPSNSTIVRVDRAKAYFEAKHNFLQELESAAIQAGLKPGEAEYEELYRYNPLVVIRWRREAWQKALRSRTAVDAKKWNIRQGWDVKPAEMRECFQERHNAKLEAAAAASSASAVASEVKGVSQLPGPETARAQPAEGSFYIAGRSSQKGASSVEEFMVRSIASDEEGSTKPMDASGPRSLSVKTALSDGGSSMPSPTSPDERKQGAIYSLTESYQGPPSTTATPADSTIPQTSTEEEGRDDIPPTTAENSRLRILNAILHPPTKKASTTRQSSGKSADGTRLIFRSGSDKISRSGSNRSRSPTKPKRSAPERTGATEVDSVALEPPAETEPLETKLFQQFLRGEFFASDDVQDDSSVPSDLDDDDGEGFDEDHEDKNLTAEDMAPTFTADQEPTAAGPTDGSNNLSHPEAIETFGVQVTPKSDLSETPRVAAEKEDSDGPKQSGPKATKIIQMFTRKKSFDQSPLYQSEVAEESEDIFPTNERSSPTRRLSGDFTPSQRRAQRRSSLAPDISLLAGQASLGSNPRKSPSFPESSVERHQSTSSSGKRIARREKKRAETTPNSVANQESPGVKSGEDGGVDQRPSMASIVAAGVSGTVESLKKLIPGRSEHRDDGYDMGAKALVDDPKGYLSEEGQVVVTAPPASSVPTAVTSPLEKSPSGQFLGVEADHHNRTSDREDGVRKGFRRGGSKSPVKGFFGIGEANSTGSEGNVLEPRASSFPTSVDYEKSPAPTSSTYSGRQRSFPETEGGRQRRNIVQTMMANIPIRRETNPQDEDQTQTPQQLSTQVHSQGTDGNQRQRRQLRIRRRQPPRSRVMDPRTSKDDVVAYLGLPMQASGTMGFHAGGLPPPRVRRPSKPDGNGRFRTSRQRRADESGKSEPEELAAQARSSMQRRQRAVRNFLAGRRPNKQVDVERYSSEGELEAVDSEVDERMFLSRAEDNDGDDSQTSESDLDDPSEKQVYGPLPSTYQLLGPDYQTDQPQGITTEHSRSLAHQVKLERVSRQLLGRLEASVRALEERDRAFAAGVLKDFQDLMTRHEIEFSTLSTPSITDTTRGEGSEAAAVLPGPTTGTSVNGPAAAVAALAGFDTSLLSPQQRSQLTTAIALAQSSAAAVEKMNEFSESLAKSDQIISQMVKRMDEIAVDVNETWSRRLKVVEDRVQQENLRRTGDSATMELAYQVFAIFLQGVAFNIWLIFQFVKLVRFVRSSFHSLRAPPSPAIPEPPALTPEAPMDDQVQTNTGTPISPGDNVSSREPNPLGAALPGL
ncbi:hypothetical protein DFJ73DRAFT_847555 [Zopfochytrium polystomum]|nr:hypothetical protein DFJ73DRAFT_847555 [Zopfochytrium polystomum]